MYPLSFTCNSGNITIVTGLSIGAIFMVLKLLFLVVFCYAECRGKSFQPNIFYGLLLLWLRCPKSSLKSSSWCCKSTSCEKKNTLPYVMCTRGSTIGLAGCGIWQFVPCGRPPLWSRYDSYECQRK